MRASHFPTSDPIATKMKLSGGKEKSHDFFLQAEKQHDELSSLRITCTPYCRGRHFGRITEQAYISY